MQPTFLFKLHYAPAQGLDSQERVVKKCDRLQSEDCCGLWLRSFQQLYQEAEPKKAFFIARVEDVNRVARFFEGSGVYSWLSSSFRHPSTSQPIAEVTFFGFDSEVQRGEGKVTLVSIPVN